MKDTDNKEAAKEEVIVLASSGGWPGPEVSKQLRMSLGEVKLILEMADSSSEPRNDLHSEGAPGEVVIPEKEAQSSESKPASVKENNVIALSRQGWENFEIAKALRIPQAEVESILELNSGASG